MKRLLIILVLVLFLVSTSGCLFFEPRLEIYNMASTVLTRVSWNEYDYGTLANGQSRSKSVVSGEGYILLSFDGNDYRTAEVVSVGLGKTTFTVTNKTVVVNRQSPTKDSSIMRIKDIMENSTVPDIK